MPFFSSHTAATCYGAVRVGFAGEARTAPPGSLSVVPLLADRKGPLVFSTHLLELKNDDGHQLVAHPDKKRAEVVVELMLPGTRLVLRLDTPTVDRLIEQLTDAVGESAP